MSTFIIIGAITKVCVKLYFAGSTSGNQQTKFLYVNEKLSRGPSLMLDSSSRSSREPRLNPVAARLHNTKKGLNANPFMILQILLNLHLCED